MNEEQAEKAVLKYLNSDNADEYGSYRSLTTIFEKVSGLLAPHADSYDVDDEMESKEALSVILNQMVSDDLLETEWGERDYERNYRLTDQGSYEASGFDTLVAELPDNASLAGSGEPITTEESVNIEIDELVGADELPITVDSSAWTGLSKTLVSSRNATVISGLIGQALDSLSTSQAGNFEVMQATALLKAARELVDAPEPPSEMIWQLIGRAADVVGLLGIFYAIFSQALNNA